MCKSKVEVEYSMWLNNDNNYAKHHRYGLIVAYSWGITV